MLRDIEGKMLITTEEHRLKQTIIVNVIKGENRIKYDKIDDLIFSFKLKDYYFLSPNFAIFLK